MFRQAIIFTKLQKKENDNKELFLRWCSIKKMKYKKIRYVLMTISGSFEIVMLTVAFAGISNRLYNMPDYKKNPSKYKITYREGLLGTYKTYTEK